MKNLLFVLLLITSFSALSQEGLPIFSSDSYQGWVYDRNDFTLSPSTIAAYKVSIYKAQNGDKYSLTSPQFNTNETTKIKVNFDWKCDSYSQNSYDILKASPTIEILNEDNKVINFITHYLPSKNLIHNISVELDVVPSSNIKVRIISHDSDIQNDGAIKKVTIKSTSLSSTEEINLDGFKIVKADNGIAIHSRNESGIVSLYNISSGKIIFEQIQDTVKGEEIFIPIINKGAYILKIGSSNYKFIF